MRTVFEKIKDSAIHIPELLLIFFSPAKAQIGLVILAVLVDTATGYWAAKKRDEPTNSKKLYPVIPKLIVYISLILLCHGIEVVFNVPNIRTLAAIALTALELMSIDENFKKATGKGILGPIIKLMKKD